MPLVVAICTTYQHLRKLGDCTSHARYPRRQLPAELPACILKWEPAATRRGSLARGQKEDNNNNNKRTFCNSGFRVAHVGAERCQRHAPSCAAPCIIDVSRGHIRVACSSNKGKLRTDIAADGEGPSAEPSFARINLLLHAQRQRVQQSSSEVCEHLLGWR